MIDTISGKTRVYGIIGNPVTHSLSPAMQNEGFAALGIDCVYIPFHVENVADAVKGIRSLNIQGSSVTIPHKETIMTYLDKIEPVAVKIGAVNTLYFEGEGKKKLLCGTNTDWIGSNRALLEEIPLSGGKIVVLGAGGSAKAIGFGLQKAGAEVLLCSRTESRGKALADELGCNWYPLEEADKLQGDALVNATSVGMQEDVSPVSKDALSSFKVVMDIVYAPLQTRLLKEAQQVGCATITGLEMLLYQGVAQFEIWTGREAPVDVMRAILLEKTGNSR